MAQKKLRGLIWRFYRDLLTYRADPSPQRKAALRTRFDRIFKRTTGFVSLDRLLKRLRANKPELLRVLERPEIPLHTNGSENDIRYQVTKRKISGGTRSDQGRDCRDAFLGLAKTCAKLGIFFWDNLGARLEVEDKPAIPYLADLVLQLLCGCRKERLTFLKILLSRCRLAELAQITTSSSLLFGEDWQPHKASGTSDSITSRLFWSPL